MTLVLEIEHLLGVAFAAREPDNPTPDWPPQPDRVFSALVAAWAARSERDEERRALEWLEMQPPPEIVASGGHPRTAPVVFVPPNDPESGRIADQAVMPTLRRRQARRFPAFRPDNPVVALVWREAVADSETLAALNVIAGDTAYIGHSASLTRCRFRDGGLPPGSAVAAGRRIYRGRLAELERDFRAAPPRRPGPGTPPRAAPKQDEAAGSLFAADWLVLEHAEGDMPDIRAAALVAKELRNTLMSGYRKTGRGDAIPAAVSGHASDGRPSSEPHLAIAPLAVVGTPYASGAVLGFALIAPRGSQLFEDDDFRRAMRAISAADAETGRRVLRAYSGAFDVTFAFGNVSGRRSLDPASYVGAGRVWASCTPIVLDRHLKEKGNAARQEEIDGLIRRACTNVRLPEPTRVSAGKHSAIEGSPSAYPSGGAPRWTRWRLPETLASRPLIHAVVEFPDIVRGPVVLGAGRFVGLGLCRPLDAERRR